VVIFSGDLFVLLILKQKPSKQNIFLETNKEELSKGMCLKFGCTIIAKREKWC
jgi:hypothetical protein